MNSLRLRLILISTIGISLCASFSLLAYGSHQNTRRMRTELNTSYELMDRAYGTVAGNKASKENVSELIAGLHPDFRKSAAENFFQRPGELSMMKLLQGENEYRAYLRSHIDYHDSRVLYYGAIAILSAISLGLLMTFFTNRFVFSPMRDLYQKMVDFLNNRYTYQFTVPEAHEIGRIHATFNAMAQKVLQQIEDLKSLDKAKTEFLSIASHELRTPLTSIKGSLGILNSGVLGTVNEAASNLMTIALTETDRLIRIINELLDLAKIEARQFPLNCQWYAADELINRTFASLEGLAQAAEVELARGEMEDVEIYMDLDRCQQILTNLMSNAIKFSPKGQPVTVSVTRTDDGEMQFSISDRGRGIAPEDQEIIFEKFRQATNSQNPLVKGTGLGLAIAKALVEQHGGGIGVRSVPDEGSTFYFTLPRWKAAGGKGALAS